jgi:hypothetical protein
VKLYRVEEENSSLNDGDINCIIRILEWANKAFRDGMGEKCKRKLIVEKLKKIKES